MPVKAYQKKGPAAHVNPPLRMGEVYRITKTLANSTVAGVGSYFAYNSSTKHVLYLAKTNEGGYDDTSALMYNHVEFVVATLAEVSNV